jgi:hypothetical protein
MLNRTFRSMDSTNCPLAGSIFTMRGPVADERSAAQTYPSWNVRSWRKVFPGTGK